MIVFRSPKLDCVLNRWLVGPLLPTHIARTAVSGSLSDADAIAVDCAKLHCTANGNIVRQRARNAYQCHGIERASSEQLHCAGGSYDLTEATYLDSVTAVEPLFDTMRGQFLPLPICWDK